MYLVTYIETLIGPFQIKGSELGVRSALLRREIKGEYTKPEDLPEDHPVTECVRQMKEYCEGRRQDFDLKLDWSGTSDFYQQVWVELLKIPYGKTVSYSTIAERIGQPSAVRAVGLANRSNPIAIIVPCHRVIGKSGELRGYFYGLDTKMLLLRHENPVKYAEQGQLF